MSSTNQTDSLAGAADEYAIRQSVEYAEQATLDFRQCTDINRHRTAVLRGRYLCAGGVWADVARGDTSAPDEPDEPAPVLNSGAALDGRVVGGVPDGARTSRS